MQTEEEIHNVRLVMQKFQDAYKARDISRLDETMALFAPRQDLEMIGVGASERTGNEWFMGLESIREIIQGDWEYWGDVVFDVEGAKITVHRDVAWLSTTGKVVQTGAFDKAMPFYVQQMKEFLEKVETDNADPDAAMMEATHFGMRRLRERAKGVGHAWPLVFTAVLIRGEQGWQFHTLHWSMPVD